MEKQRQRRMAGLEEEEDPEQKPRTAQEAAQRQLAAMQAPVVKRSLILSL